MDTTAQLQYQVHSTLTQLYTCRSPGYVSIGLVTCTYIHVHIGIGPAFLFFTQTHGTVCNLPYTCKVYEEQCGGVC